MEEPLGTECGGGRSGRPRGAVRGREGKGHGKAIASGDTSSLAAYGNKSYPRRTLTGWQGEARWRLEIYGRQSTKRINCPVGTVS